VSALEDHEVELTPAALMTDGATGDAADPIALLDRVRALHEEGLPLRAYRLGRRLGPPETWKGTAALVLAGRLAPHLGATRLATALHFRAWRSDRTDPQACYYHAYGLLVRRGALSTWRFLRQVGLLEQAPATMQSDWLAAHAIVLGQLRDFDASESWLARAMELTPDRADAQSWMLLNLVYALRALGRDREANEVSRRAAALAADHCTPYHFLWLILDHLFDGQAAMARGRLNGLNLSTFDSKNSYLYRLAQLLLEIAEARPNLSRGARRKASRDLAAMNRSLRFGVDTHAAIMQLFHRAVRFMARDYSRIHGIYWKLAARMNLPLRRV
jgi:hypothetical protein